MNKDQLEFRYKIPGKQWTDWKDVPGAALDRETAQWIYQLPEHVTAIEGTEIELRSSVSLKERS
jgi:hypothetical protein